MYIHKHIYDELKNVLKTEVPETYKSPSTRNPRVVNSRVLNPSKAGDRILKIVIVAVVKILGKGS